VDEIQPRFNAFSFSAKSPLFSHVNATMNGLPTIRSTGDKIEKMMRNHFDVLQDYHSGSWYLVLVCSTFFGFIIDLLTCLFIASLCFSLVFLAQHSTHRPFSVLH